MMTPSQPLSCPHTTNAVDNLVRNQEATAAPSKALISGSPILQARSINKVFRSGGLFKGKGTGLRALDDVSLSILPGEVVGLVGESGSGKTTFGKVVVRLLKPDHGQILFMGQDLFALPGAQLRAMRHRLQMLFQNPSSTLHPKMTIGALVRESLKIHRGFTGSVANEAMESLLKKVSLQGRSSAYPDELSGGQKRRVGIARILAAKPEFVVADEPTSGLDALLRAEIVDLLMEVRDAGVAYLIISHDLNVVQRACDRIAVMFRGRIVEELPKSTMDQEEHHPYTIELFNAAARLRGAVDKVQQITQQTDLAAHHQGCPYLSRCQLAAARPDLAKNRCARFQPPLSNFGKNHKIACHGMNDFNPEPSVPGAAPQSTGRP